MKESGDGLPQEGMNTEIRCTQCGKSFHIDLIEGQFAGACPRCIAGFILETAPAAPNEPLPIKPGATFRGIEVQDVLGRGGMGVVYRARQLDLDRPVALKVMTPKYAADAEFAERFNREAKALATLSHPNIVQVYDFGREADFCFLAMEFVDGTSLRGVLKEGRPSPAEALRLIGQICDALEYAHSRGVVHRDIKPENILIDRNGQVKIVDFGLAKVTAKEGGGPALTHTDVAMGTPQYMAPEQYLSMKTVDHRADIYSLGVVFYELLTGEIPAGSFMPPSHKSKSDERLDPVVLKAMAKEPERRYQCIADVKSDVRTATTAAPPTRPPRDVSRRLLFVGCIFAAFMPVILMLAERYPGPRLLRRDWTEILIIAAGALAIATGAVALRFRHRIAGGLALVTGVAAVIGGYVLIEERRANTWDARGRPPERVHAVLMTLKPERGALPLDDETFRALERGVPLALMGNAGVPFDFKRDATRLVSDAQAFMKPRFVTRDEGGSVECDGRRINVGPHTLVFFVPDYGAYDAGWVQREKFAAAIAVQATIGMSVELQTQVVTIAKQEGFREVGEQDAETAAKLAREAYAKYREKPGDVAQLTTAIRALEKAWRLSKRPPAAVLRDLGEAYIAAQRYREARAALEACVGADTKSVEPRLLLGEALTALGKFDSAIMSYDAAIEIAPDDITAHAGKAEALMYRADFVSALRSYDRAVALQPDNEALRLFRRLADVETGGISIKGAHRVETASCEVETTVGEEYAKSIARHTDAIFAEYARVLKPVSVPSRRIRVTVFASRAEFDEYGLPHMAGYYTPYSNRLMLVRGDSDETLHEQLYHECFHHFLSLYVVHAPLWLAEGYGEYFAAHVLDPATGAFSVRPNRARKTGMRAALATKGVSPLAELLRMPKEAFYGKAVAHYAQSWSFVYFMRHSGAEERERLFDQYFRLLIQLDDAHAAYDVTFGRLDLDKLEKEWVAFAQK